MDINEVALRKLANRERTKKEMEKFLFDKGFEAEEIKECISELELHKYINDKNYATSYLRYSLGKRKAISRIKRELLQKGVEKYDIEDGFYEYECDTSIDLETLQIQNAKKEAEKYLGNKEILEKKDFARLGRRLNTLGYNSSLIYNIIGEYMEEQNYG